MNQTDKTNIIIACDHGGIEVKEKLKSILDKKKNIEKIIDLGTYEEKSIDYPQITERACLYLLHNMKDSKALIILVCGTGIGVSIAANKIKGIRCALVHDVYTAKMAKMHNHANCLAFGGRVSYQNSLERIIDSYLNTEVSLEERHLNRLSQIETLEEN